MSKIVLTIADKSVEIHDKDIDENIALTELFQYIIQAVRGHGYFLYECELYKSTLEDIENSI